MLGVAAYAGYLLATWSAFQPKHVAVSGTVHTPAREIRNVAQIAADRNVWLMDKHAAERRVDALPWVHDAEIHRSLPATVRIVVHERVPAACVQSGGLRYLIDASGHVIELGCTAASVVAIAWPRALSVQAPGSVLDAALVRRLLADDASLRAGGLAPVQLGVDRFDGLEAKLRGGLLVRFGDDGGLVQKAGLVGPILRSYRGGERELAAIDLRAPGTPVVELRRPKK